MQTLALRENGLVLITGPTGSGKSTTLAAMIGLVNATQKKHIITLEDPIGPSTGQRLPREPAGDGVAHEVVRSSPRAASAGPTSSSWARCGTSRRSVLR